MVQDLICLQTRGILCYFNTSVFTTQLSIKTHPTVNFIKTKTASTKTESKRRRALKTVRTYNTAVTASASRKHLTLLWDGESLRETKFYGNIRKYISLPFKN